MQPVRKCQQCPYFTKRVHFLKIHKKRNESQKPYNCGSDLEELSCQKCDFSTRLVSSFNRHLQYCKIKEEQISGIEPFSCMTATIEKYLCAQCDFSTHFSINLKKHTKKVHGFKTETTRKTNHLTYKCEKCDYRTRWPHNYNNHLISKHTPPDKIKWHLCKHCDYKSKFPERLKIHIKYKHVPSYRVKWHKCPHCPYTTPYRGSIVVHINAKHTEPDAIKWYRCHLCSYKAKMPSYVDRHVKSQHVPENEIEWYYCEFCDYKTKHNRAVLRQHVAKKHNQKGPKCEQCGLEYKTNARLPVHVCRKREPPGEIKWRNKTLLKDILLKIMK